MDYYISTNGSFWLTVSAIHNRQVAWVRVRVNLPIKQGCELIKLAPLPHIWLSCLFWLVNFSSNLNENWWTFLLHGNTHMEIPSQLLCNACQRSSTVNLIWSWLILLLGWFLIWKLFLVRFTFIRELVYGSEDSGKKSRETTGAEKDDTPLRRSSRLRERQNKNQHGQLWKIILRQDF